MHWLNRDTDKRATWTLPTDRCWHAAPLLTSPLTCRIIVCLALKTLLVFARGLIDHHHAHAASGAECTVAYLTTSASPHRNYPPCSRFAAFRPLQLARRGARLLLPPSSRQCVLSAPTTTRRTTSGSRCVQCSLPRVASKLQHTTTRILAHSSSVMRGARVNVLTDRGCVGCAGGWHDCASGYH